MRWPLLFVVFTVATLSGFSQLVPPDTLNNTNQTATHLHAHAAPARIDGASHPELIPDLTAYRLFLVVAAQRPNASPGESNAQQSHQRKLGLSVRDAQTFMTVSQKFSVAYEDLINRYNASADSLFASSGQAPDYAAFAAKRDALVKSTVDDLHQELTAEGSARLDAIVQQEKRHMTIASN